MKIQSHFPPADEFGGIMIHANPSIAGSPALVCMTAQNGAFRMCEFFTSAQAREFAQALELAAEQVEKMEVMR